MANRAVSSAAVGSPPTIAHLYQALWRLASPWVRRALTRRVARGIEDPARAPERFGLGEAPGADGPRIWLHAAGRGETVAARALLRGLREAGFDGPVLVTTFSPSGVPLIEGLEGVEHRFAPLDDRRWTARFLEVWRPALCVVMEADIWPNMLWEVDRRVIPRALCSARISPRSVRRWRGVGRPLAASLFGGFGLVLATDEEQANRFERLGAGPVEVGGCLKAAADGLPVDAGLVETLRDAAGRRPLVVAASTHEGEEALITAALADLDGLVVLAPRYVDRGAEVAGVAAEGASRPADPREHALLGRRSLGQLPAPGDRWWIADSMGELGTLFEAADLVIVGGSFVGGGGHNLAEPARFGRATITGPGCSANTATTEALVRAGATLQVEAEALARTVEELLADEARRRSMEEAARQVVAGWEERRRRCARRLLAFAELEVTADEGAS